MASSSGNAMRTVWFLLKGDLQQSDVSVPVDATVSALKRAVHSECHNTLPSVDARQLRIYLKHGDEEALDPMDTIPAQEMGENRKPIPFFVDYPDVGAEEPSSDKAGKLVCVMENFMTEFRPVLEDYQQRQTKELDPWSDMSHMTPQIDGFKEKLIQYYQCRGKGSLVFCQISKLCLPQWKVAAAHIWPWGRRDQGLKKFGLSEGDINDPRNGLLLAKNIEVAFDRKQVCFLYDFIKSRLLLSVVDKDIMELWVDDYQTLKFKDIHRNELWTNEGKSLPYRRLLSWHAARTLQKFGQFDQSKRYDELSLESPGYRFPQDTYDTMVKEGMAMSSKADD